MSLDDMESNRIKPNTNTGQYVCPTSHTHDNYYLCMTSNGPELPTYDYLTGIFDKQNHIKYINQHMKIRYIAYILQGVVIKGLTTLPRQHSRKRSRMNRL